MICPSCKSTNIGVYMTRDGGTHVRRYRKCRCCGQNFVTEERYAEDVLREQVEEVSVNVMLKL